MEYDLINTGMSMVVANNNNNNKVKNIITNTTTTVDKLLENEKNITLIKFDIENYEYFALLGSENIINKFHPVIANRTT
jgi:hypothetical protein